VLTAYWAAKGGAGATVLAAAHAVHAAASHPTVAVDLDGDLAAALGVEAADRPGVADWLRAGADVPADGLDRLLLPVAGDLWLLPRGAGSLAAERAGVLGQLLARSPREVVVDAGTRPGPAARAVVRAADRSTLVARACYLAARRLQEIDLAPTDIVLVREPQRALGADDVARAAGAPVRAVVPIDPAIARAVDAGLLTARLPRRLSRAVAPPHRGAA
jgi:Flp pilus assembly CpaE family ATPase